jgi:hypothetical protein
MVLKHTAGSFCSRSCCSPPRRLPRLRQSSSFESAASINGSTSRASRITAIRSRRNTRRRSTRCSIRSGRRARAHRCAEDARAIAAADEQQKLDAAQRANRDKNLLNTYVSVQEIERLRDQRLALLTDQIKVTSQFLEILNGKMNKLEKTSDALQALQPDPKRRRCPTSSPRTWCASAATSTRRKRICARSAREEAMMNKQFESDIARFKELKGIH